MDRLGFPPKSGDEANPISVDDEDGDERAQACGSHRTLPPRKASSQNQLCPYRKPTPVGKEKPPQMNE